MFLFCFFLSLVYLTTIAVVCINKKMASDESGIFDNYRSGSNLQNGHSILHHCLLFSLSSARKYCHGIYICDL
jgi:hypothetical protein